ncbi:hypothetical protein AAHS21_29405 [Mycobacterium sp. 050272]|uniref:hypothetical protein n=1 Tax=Mycobacteriaceae TaxID=1762 RepID=UPI00319B5090
MSSDQMMTRIGLHTVENRPIFDVGGIKASAQQENCAFARIGKWSVIRFDRTVRRAVMRSRPDSTTNNCRDGDH